MAALAEAVLAENAVRLGIGMAADAVLQAVFCRADTPVQSRVTLVPEHVHVIAAHELGVVHASLAPKDIDPRTDACRPGAGRERNANGEQAKSQ